MPGTSGNFADIFARKHLHFYDEQGVSPIAATLVLIIVAIMAAVAISWLLGNLTSDISGRTNNVDVGGIQLLIAGSAALQPVNQLLAEQYMADHSGVSIITQGGGSAAGVVAIGQGIADIGALSRAITPDEHAHYPRLKSALVGGRAIVIIAHDDLNMLPTTGVSQLDLQTVYSPYKQTLSPLLFGIKAAVRNTDDLGSEEIFAGWLTDDHALSLDGYTITPDDVAMVNARGDADVFSIVSSTPGAIGFIDWLYVSENNPATSHVNVLPVINKANGQVQVPGDDKIVAEINNLNNDNYDSGLVNQLFYVTNGEPGSVASDYIKYAISPDTIALYHQAKTCCLFDLK